MEVHSPTADQAAHMAPNVAEEILTSDAQGEWTSRTETVFPQATYTDISADPVSEETLLLASEIPHDLAVDTPSVDASELAPQDASDDFPEVSLEKKGAGRYRRRQVVASLLAVASLLTLAGLLTLGYKKGKKIAAPRGSYLERLSEKDKALVSYMEKALARAESGPVWFANQGEFRDLALGVVWWDDAASLGKLANELPKLLASVKSEPYRFLSSYFQAADQVSRMAREHHELKVALLSEGSDSSRSTTGFIDSALWWSDLVMTNINYARTALQAGQFGEWSDREAWHAVLNAVEAYNQSASLLCNAVKRSGPKTDQAATIAAREAATAQLGVLRETLRRNSSVLPEGGETILGTGVFGMF